MVDKNECGSNLSFVLVIEGLGSEPEYVLYSNSP